MDLMQLSNAILTLLPPLTMISFYLPHCHHSTPECLLHTQWHLMGWAKGDVGPRCHKGGGDKIAFRH